MLLDLFSKKVLINGKKVSTNKVTNIIEEAVNNIIITGFKSIPELEKIVSVNGRNCDYLIDNILYKLQISYTDSIEKESEKALTDKTAAYNVSLMIANQMIVLKLLNNRINNFINTVPEEVKKIEQKEQEEEIEDLNYEDDDEDSTEYDNTSSDAISRMIEAGRNKVSNAFVVRDRRNAQ